VFVVVVVAVVEIPSFIRGIYSYIPETTTFSRAYKVKNHSVVAIHGTSLLPYLLTAWTIVLLEKLIGSQLVKKFLLWNPEFHYCLTCTHLLSLS
jgi:hypothetical protein